MPRIGMTVKAEMGEIVSRRHAGNAAPGPLQAAAPTRGGYMFRSTWHTHWHAIRAAAGMPNQDFYELKHRAIQWMVDPVSDGGLGLDPATVAEMVGHDDGGYLIATVYTKLGQRRALARAQQAMVAYQECQDSATAEGPRLHVVGT